MFEHEIFRKQIYSLKKELVTLLGLFCALHRHSHPGRENVPSLLPLRYAPAPPCFGLATFIVHSRLVVD